MNRSLSLLLVLIVLAAAAIFVWATGRWLPPLVASHFDGSGVANAFMPRDRYVQAMLLFIVGVPALLVLGAHVVGIPGIRINVPNAAYWLTPDRRAGTVDAIRSRMLGFAVALCAFLCYVHWLVVRANAAHPVELSGPAIYGGLAVFLVFSIAWAVALHRRFALPG
jgi:uncharacterized membrane protein